MLSAFACMALLAVGCKDDPVDDPAPDRQPVVDIQLVNEGETAIEITLAAYDADQMAYCVVNADDAATVDAAAVFAQGTSKPASETPENIVISDLAAGTSYKIYAAAVKADVYSDVVSVAAATTVPVAHELISDVVPDGINLSYTIDLGDNSQCYHTYIEKWFFDYQLAVAMQVDGPGFDRDNFIRNLLADYGVQSEVSGIYEWKSGEDHPTRRTVALTPGKDYYVIAAALDNESWSEQKASLVPFKMPDPNGMSSENIELIVTELTNETVTVRMECDETKVAFFFFDLYGKQQFDEFKAEKGEYGMMDFLFEYSDGNVSGNTYTDKRAVSAGESYMFAVYGVDYNGSEIYKELQIDVPGYDPSIELEVLPYERELQGYHDYDSFLMTLEPQHFANELNPDMIYCSMMPMERSTFDAYLGYFGLEGMDLPQLEAAFAQQPELLLQLQSMFYLYPVSYDDAAVAALQSEGYFERVFSDLYPDTEYVTIAFAVDGETSVARLVSAKTAVMPEQQEASEAYKAYLGNWTLSGKTTADWLTYETYDLRIEEFTPNRSYKVYGWSHSALSQEFPFVMRFHPETGKISIDGPQLLGTTIFNDTEMEVWIYGKMYVSGYDDLVLLLGYNGPMYRGNLSGTHLSMFSEILSVGGVSKEFMAINYLLRSGNDYYRTEDDGYDLVYFSIDRAAGAAASLAGRSPLRSSANRVETVKWVKYDAAEAMTVQPVKVSAPAVAAGSHVHAKLQSVAKAE